MAKTDKNATPQEDAVIETPTEQPQAESVQRTAEVKTEVELKAGQCIISPVGKTEREIVTTMDDWKSLYNAGKNEGKFILKAEKKR